jgi:hypothetical protein
MAYALLSACNITNTPPVKAIMIYEKGEAITKRIQ